MIGTIKLSNPLPVSMRFGLPLSKIYTTQCCEWNINTKLLVNLMSDMEVVSERGALLLVLLGSLEGSVIPFIPHESILGFTQLVYANLFHGHL